MGIASIKDLALLCRRLKKRRLTQIFVDYFFTIEDTEGIIYLSALICENLRFKKYSITQ